MSTKRIIVSVHSKLSPAGANTSQVAAKQPATTLKWRAQVEIKRWIAFFMIILFLSGLTPIPVDFELTTLLKILPRNSSMHDWLGSILSAYRNINIQSRFLLYGYDWLAFAHFILAILFIGPYRDPAKNIWVIEFGMIACVLVIPLALIAGHFRQIPTTWQLVDCSFGVFGFIPLKIIYTKTTNLIKTQNTKKYE